MKLISKSILFLAVFILSTPTMAVTINVAKWGADNATCGKSSDPCLSIQQGIDNAGTKGKIVVYPGVYTENINITQEGQKLESIAGRYATIIEAASTSSHVLSITTEKVLVGKKSKGFTFTGATDTSQAGISTGTDCDNCKIEGNLARGNYYGFDLDGEKIQVRYNIAKNNNDHGIILNSNFGIMQNNVAWDNGDVGFKTDWSYLVSFSDNLSYSNSIGMQFGPFLTFANKITNNVAVANSSDGFYITDMDGSQLISNISSNNIRDGFDLNHDPVLKPLPRISGNLAVANAEQGFEIDNVANAKFDGNSSIANKFVGIFLDSGTSMSSFRNNNTYGATDHSYGIINNNTNPLLNYIQHFFGATTGPDPDIDFDGHGAIFRATGTHSTKENKFKAKKAAAL